MKIDNSRAIELIYREYVICTRISAIPLSRSNCHCELETRNVDCPTLEYFSCFEQQVIRFAYRSAETRARYLRTHRLRRSYGIQGTRLVARGTAFARYRRYPLHRLTTRRWSRLIERSSSMKVDELTVSIGRLLVVLFLQKSIFSIGELSCSNFALTDVNSRICLFYRTLG